MAGELTLLSEATDRLRGSTTAWKCSRISTQLANDRLSEFSYFSREYRLELWIIVLLVAEVVIMAVELRQSFR